MLSTEFAPPGVIFLASVLFRTTICEWAGHGAPHVIQMGGALAKPL